MFCKIFKYNVIELLRKSAEHSVKDIVQLLFSRLPEFADDHRMSGKVGHELKFSKRMKSSILQKLKMRATNMETTNKKQKKSKAGFRSKSKGSKSEEAAPENSEETSQANKIKGLYLGRGSMVITKIFSLEMEKTPEPAAASPTKMLAVPGFKQQHLSTTPITPGGNIVDMQGVIHQSPMIPEEEATPDKQGLDSGAESPPVDNLHEFAIESEANQDPSGPSPDIDCGPCVVITMEDALEEETRDLEPEETEELLPKQSEVDEERGECDQVCSNHLK